MSLFVNSSVMLDHVLAKLRNGIAIDAGANDGGYTQRMIDAGMLVHAFEPVPDVFDRLSQRFSNDSRVRLNRRALSDRSELLLNQTVLSCWTLGPKGTSGLDTAVEYVDKPGFNVRTITLDEYLNRFFGAPVDFIKLDVDGYEHRVLQGATRTLLTRPPILCELNCYIHKLGGSPREFMELVFRSGYTVVPMDGHARFDTWEAIEPHWPYHSSYDVMLMPDDFQPLTDPA